MRWVRELNSGSGELVSSATFAPKVDIYSAAQKNEIARGAPRRSYSWDEMQTAALFWAGKAKLDSRMRRLTDLKI